MKVKICELSQEDLRIGRPVRTNGNGNSTTTYIIEGVIGEIVGHNIYIWHNDASHMGACGHISPNSYGYEYSWVIYNYNKDAWIEFLDEKKKRTKKIKITKDTICNTITEFLLKEDKVYKKIRRTRKPKILDIITV